MVDSLEIYEIRGEFGKNSLIIVYRGSDLSKFL